MQLQDEVQQLRRMELAEEVIRLVEDDAVPAAALAAWSAIALSTRARTRERALGERQSSYSSWYRTQDWANASPSSSRPFGTRSR